MKTALLPYWWLLATGSLNTDLQPRTEFATLVVYRQREFGGNAYAIRLNGKNVGSLLPNHYVKLGAPPGRAKIESAKNYFSDNQTIWLTLQPGRTYYVKAVEEMDFMSRTLLLAPVSDEQAQRELRSIKPATLSSPNPTD